MWAIEAVALLVVKDERICLVRETGSRPEIGKFAGQLSIPMGHIDNGESPEEAALREFTEETGLTAAIDYPLGFFGIVMPEGERAAVWAYKGRLVGGKKNSAAVVWLSEKDFLALDPFALRPLNHDLYQIYILARFLGHFVGDEIVSKIVARSMPQVAFRVPTEAP